jgi:hypothetical protein
VNKLAWVIVLSLLGCGSVADVPDATTRPDAAGTPDGAIDAAGTPDAGPDAAPAACGDGVPTPGQLCFDESTLVSTSDVTYSARLTDVNGDGNRDLVYLIGDQVVVDLGDGAGTFPDRIDGPTVFGATLETPDLDGDGTADLVVLEPYDGMLHAYLANGDASFTETTALTGLSEPSSVARGDLNGDGLEDVAVGSAAGQTVATYVSSGAALTYATGLSVHGAVPGVAIADVSGDGHPDLAYTVNEPTTDSSGVFRVLGDGSGGLMTPLPALVAADGACGIVGADLDGDGRADLAYVNSLTSSVGVLLSAGAGGFEAEATYPAADTPLVIVAGDVTNDGVPDLVVGHQGAELGIYVGAGDGSFAEPVSFALSTGVAALSLGDVNGDDIPDIAVSAYGGTELITVLLSTP